MSIASQAVECNCTEGTFSCKFAVKAAPGNVTEEQLKTITKQVLWMNLWSLSTNPSSPEGLNAKTRDPATPSAQFGSGNFPPSSCMAAWICSLSTISSTTYGTVVSTSCGKWHPRVSTHLARTPSSRGNKWSGCSGGLSWPCQKRGIHHGGKRCQAPDPCVLRLRVPPRLSVAMSDLA